MIVIDSSVWIDHLRAANPALNAILERRLQRVHPFVIGEVMLGSLRDRQQILDLLQKMPKAAVATHREVMGLIDDQKLHGLGIGFVDVHLLASAKLMPGARIWTRDRRLANVCGRLDLVFHALH